MIDPDRSYYRLARFDPVHRPSGCQVTGTTRTAQKQIDKETTSIRPLLLFLTIIIPVYLAHLDTMAFPRPKPTTVSVPTRITALRFPR
jgi:hypothetical protein